MLFGLPMWIRKFSFTPVVLDLHYSIYFLQIGRWFRHQMILITVITVYQCKRYFLRKGNKLASLLYLPTKINLQKFYSLVWFTSLLTLFVRLEVVRVPVSAYGRYQKSRWWLALGGLRLHWHFGMRVSFQFKWNTAANSLRIYEFICRLKCF